MGNRLYVGGIVVFWLAAMTWLVTEKVLPPFFSGEAPRTGTLRQNQPVAWRIDLDGADCGRAVVQATPGGQGIREVHSLVRVDRLPRPRALPVWLGQLASALDSLSLTSRTRTAFDGFGRLARFETRIRVNQLEFPIVVTGTVAGHSIRLSVRAGDFSKRIERSWPADGVLAHDVLPETKLLDVYVGKRWRREVFSPFAGRREPVEMLEAVVTEEVKLADAGDAVTARLIEYRAPGRTGASDAERLRARMWVGEDGRVRMQETYLFGSRLTFTRLDDAASRRIAQRDLQLSRHASMLKPRLDRRGVPRADAGGDGRDAEASPGGRPDGGERPDSTSL